MQLVCPSSNKILPNEINQHFDKNMNFALDLTSLVFLYYWFCIKLYIFISLITKYKYQTSDSSIKKASYS